MALKAEKEGEDELAEQYAATAAEEYRKAGILNRMAEIKQQAAKTKGNVDWTEFRTLQSSLAGEPADGGATTDGGGVQSQPGGDDDGLERIDEIEQEIADLTAQLKELEAELSKVRRMKAREPSPIKK